MAGARHKMTLEYIAIRLERAGLDIPLHSNYRKSIKSSIVNSITGGSLERNTRHAYVSALKGVTCKINKGERVGLIGHNGAGKSTFLRLISGIYKATSGTVCRNVEVFPMIYKSFLTGNELNGVEAIKAHYLINYKTMDGFQAFLDEVIGFSGIGDFVYLPIKTYSEGMVSRLLFSMLTTGSYECLALDEGFGTGDASFFSKAETRIKNFIKASSTLVMANHSDTLLRQFCERGLVFEKGSIVFDGGINEALSYYHGIVSI